MEFFPPIYADSEYVADALYANAAGPVLVATGGAIDVPEIFLPDLWSRSGRKPSIRKLHPDDRISKAFAEVTPVTEAITQGIRQAMAVHKRLGHSVVVCRDGKVVWLPAEEIPVDISESDNPKPYATDAG